MTADPIRRRRASRFGIVALVVAVAAVVGLGVVAVGTLRSSQEGTTVRPDDGPEQRFPSTPLALLGVVDGERLTAAVAVVLAPDGTGGSVVSVPVNVDTSAGFGDERTPFSRRAFAVGDAGPLLEELAPLLGVEASFAEVVDAARLAELLAVDREVGVSFDRDVIDAVDGDAVTVVEAGERLLDGDEIVSVLTSVPPDGPSFDAHATDVAVWAGLAESWSSTSVPLELERDEVGVPAEPASVDEVFERLRAGRVSSRDVAIDRSLPLTLDNPTEADFVSLDVNDSVMVFASVAPAQVLTPNPTLTFSIVAPFSRSQLATVGDDVTTESLVRRLIGDLRLVDGNVVFVDLEPADGGAPTETVVVVDEEGSEESASVPLLIGPSTSRIAARDTVGSDVTLLLGTDFLDYRAAIFAELEAERADDGDADFDVSADDGADTGDTPEENDEDAAPDEPGTVGADE